jgi:hypothetical protein
VLPVIGYRQSFVFYPQVIYHDLLRNLDYVRNIGVLLLDEIKGSKEALRKNLGLVHWIMVVIVHAVIMTPRTLYILVGMMT